MSKMQEVYNGMIAAMKAKNKERKDVLSYLYGVLKNAEIDKRSPLTDQEVDTIILKQIKQTEDVIKVTPSGRIDIIEENKFTISVLTEYAPKMMSEEEIRNEVLFVLNDLGIEAGNVSSRDRGKIMGKLMPKVKGKADGSMVNKIVSSYLKNE